MTESNIPAITVDMFSSIIERMYNDGNFRPIFGLGKGGIGKTESIEFLAKQKLKIGYIDIRLLLYNETDLKGIPYPNVDHTKTIWLQNDILPTVERDGETGILVFDEITSCAKSVRTAAYQLLNERRLGDYVLPEKWMIICLGNGEEDGGDYQGMEGNFANRCSVFNVIPNVESWKLWAMKNGINELVTAYVSWRPQDLHSYNPDSETELLFASPRSWTAVSNVLNKHPFKDNNVELRAIIESNLGQRVGQMFVSFCKFKDKAIDPMQIVKGLKSPQIKQQEVLMITIQSVIKIVGDRIVEGVKRENKITPTNLQYLANALKWILTLDKLEHSVMGFKDLVSYDEKIMRVVLVSEELNTICPDILRFVKAQKIIFS